MTKGHGGPAFPVPNNAVTGGGTSRGMLLRDYFAAAAMQGLAPGVAEAANTFAGNPERIFPMAARLAYMLADAMLEERDRVDKIPE